MNTDPTEYPNQPRIEPTEPISDANPYASIGPYYGNPYEHTEPPYYQSIPLVPPPPPGKRVGNILLLWIISIGGLLLVGVLIFFGINGFPWQQSRAVTLSPTTSLVPTATTIPTPATTPTAIPTSPPTTATPIITGAKAPYPASQIVADFYKAGLTPQATPIDTSWSCCQYYPEGGAVYWNDVQTGITMDLATFASIDEAQIDGKNLKDRGFNGYVVNYCLLSYGGNPSDVQSYLSIMDQICIYQ
mgnify:CR=1 FL=1